MCRAPPPAPAASRQPLPPRRLVTDNTGTTRAYHEQGGHQPAALRRGTRAEGVGRKARAKPLRGTGVSACILRAPHRPAIRRDACPQAACLPRTLGLAARMPAKALNLPYSARQGAGIGKLPHPSTKSPDKAVYDPAKAPARFRNQLCSEKWHRACTKPTVYGQCRPTCECCTSFLSRTTLFLLEHRIGAEPRGPAFIKQASDG